MVDVVVDVVEGEVQLSQPLADCTTEREGTSVPVVISRSNPKLSSSSGLSAKAMVEIL